MNPLCLLLAVMEDNLQIVVRYWLHDQVTWQKLQLVM